MKSLFVFSAGLVLGFIGGCVYVVQKNIKDEKFFEQDGEADIINFEDGRRYSYAELNPKYKKEVEENDTVPGNEEETSEDENANETDVKDDFMENEDEEVIEEDLAAEQEERDEEYFAWHQMNKDHPPKILTGDEVDGLPNFIDNEAMYYYSVDKVLVDDDDVEVEEPERLIGNDIDLDEAFEDAEDNVIFILNKALDTCYEIMKLDKPWYIETKDEDF